MTVTRENHHAIADTVNRIAEIGVSASGSIPIFAQMSMRSKAARLVITLSVRCSNGEIKAVR
jgi:hypothetical protein